MKIFELINNFSKNFEELPIYLKENYSSVYRCETYYLSKFLQEVRAIDFFRVNVLIWPTLRVPGVGQYSNLDTFLEQRLEFLLVTRIKTCY